MSLNVAVNVSECFSKCHVTANSYTIILFKIKQLYIKNCSIRMHKK